MTYCIPTIFGKKKKIVEYFLGKLGTFGDKKCIYVVYKQN